MCCVSSWSASKSEFQIEKRKIFSKNISETLSHHGFTLPPGVMNNADARGSLLHRKNQQFVVVSPRSELLVVERPLQTTHFLAVARQFRHVRCVCSNVTNVNGTITTSGRQQRTVPSHRADSGLMPGHRSYFLAFRRVPHLHISRRGTNTDVASSLCPCHGSDGVFAA